MHSILTRTDADAQQQLEESAHHFLAMLDHVSRFHRSVITSDFIGSLLDEFDYLEAKYGWPKPTLPGV